MSEKPLTDLLVAAKRYRDVHSEWLRSGVFLHAQYVDATAALQTAALEYARHQDPHDEEAGVS